MGEISAELPWPPSVNRYYRHVGYKVLISREGRQYRRMTVSRLGGTPKLNGRLSLYADFYPPDNRRRDLDNVGGKCFLDSLQAAGLFDDDSQIKVLHLEMHEPISPDGLVHFTLKEMDDDSQTSRISAGGGERRVETPAGEG